MDILIKISHAARSSGSGQSKVRCGNNVRISVRTDRWESSLRLWERKSSKANSSELHHPRSKVRLRGRILLACQNLKPYLARRMEPLDEDFYSDGAEEEDFDVASAAAPLAAPEPEEGETEVSG